MPQETCWSDFQKKVFHIDEDFQLHCQNAINYFSENPSAIKMRRKDPVSQSSNSFIKIEGKIYVVAAHGELLGEGKFGRVKLAMCIDPRDEKNLYALKIEEDITNIENSKEIELSKVYGLHVGGRVMRGNAQKTIDTFVDMDDFTDMDALEEMDKQDKVKSYSIMHYRGVSLASKLASEATINNAHQLVRLKQERLRIAIDACLSAHELHKTYGIAHRDLKPANMAVDQDGRIHLIDFGSAVLIKDDEGVGEHLVGTPNYLPGANDFFKSMTYMSQLGAEGTDTFALKRIIRHSNASIASILDERFSPLPAYLQAMLSTNDLENTVHRKEMDTPLHIAAQLICYQANINIDGNLDEKTQKAIVDIFQDDNQLDKKQALELVLNTMHSQERALDKPPWSELQKMAFKIDVNFDQECERAIQYFIDNPDETKMRRSDPNARTTNSFIKIDNKIYIMAVKGNIVGEGSSGRAKFAMCIQPFVHDSSNLYVIKTEAAKTPEHKQRIISSQEATLSKQYGLLVGEPLHRENAGKEQSDKYYSVLHYRGESLKAWLDDVKPSKDSSQQEIIANERMRVAIELCLKVHELHETFQITHGDLKLENITLDQYGNAHIIDLGSAKPTTDKTTIFQGTPAYLPVDPLNRTIQQCLFNMTALGPIGTDTFALKRLISYPNIAGETNLPRSIINVDMSSLPEPLREMLNTDDPNAAAQRKQDTPLLLATQLICHQAKLTVDTDLSEEKQKYIVQLYQNLIRVSHDITMISNAIKLIIEKSPSETELEHIKNGILDHKEQETRSNQGLSDDDLTPRRH